jgi:hypothetical protein
MPQIGGKPKVSKTTKTPKKKSSSSTTKRNFTVVIGSKEHGLYVSSSPSSAARKAVSKLCATDKKRKVSFHIREITQGSKKKTYGPYLGYIEKLAKPIELKGRVIRYKPVAKLSGKTAKAVVKKGGILGGGENLSNKKGGMERTGASSASSASSNDSQKRKYPRDLHEVRSKEELLSLIAWVKFVKEKREKYLEIKQQHSLHPNNNINNINQVALNNKNEQGFTFQNRENYKSMCIDELNKKFKNIPRLTDDNLNFLINFIINNPHDGLGPYSDESYFKGIEDYVRKMKKNPEWRPKKSNVNFENFLGNNSNISNYDN